MEKSKILRIIDVNINRSMEGIRVVEEICRFILEDRKATEGMKNLRGELLRAIKRLGSRDRVIEHRRSESDVGRELYSEEEGKRAGLSAIFYSNIKRAQEAVRCLEEFSKLLRRRSGKDFKNIRFKLYETEKELARRIVKYEKLDFDLYVVTDPRFGHIPTLQKAISAGVMAIQLRAKDLSEKQYGKLARQFSVRAKKHRLAFFLNDHWGMVKRVGADGVHLGQEDIQGASIRRIKEIMGEDKILGISTHSLAQARQAQKLGADYISLGPIFKTPSKPKTKPVGTKLLKKVIKTIKVPVVAIGGINGKNISAIEKAGCTRAAVIRAGVTGIKPLIRNFRRAEGIYSSWQ